MGKINKKLEAQVGRYYKAKILGYDDVMVKYDGPIGKKSHCATCTCVDNRPLYVLVSAHPAVGAGNQDVELLEEVEKPVGV